MSFTQFCGVNFYPLFKFCHPLPPKKLMSLILTSFTKYEVYKTSYHVNDFATWKKKTHETSDN